MPKKGITKTAAEVEKKNKPRKTKIPKDEAVSEAEIQHKQFLAIVLKIATYTNTEIAEAIGERKTTIRKWFQDPQVIALYEKTYETIGVAAKQFLESLTIQAVKRVGEIMNQNTDKKLALEAAFGIMDRGGLPKLSRSESKTETENTDSKKISLTNAAGDDLAVALAGVKDPVILEEATKLVDQLEGVLQRAAEDA